MTWEFQFNLSSNIFDSVHSIYSIRPCMWHRYVNTWHDFLKQTDYAIHEPGLLSWHFLDKHDNAVWRIYFTRLWKTVLFSGTNIYFKSWWVSAYMGTTLWRILGIYELLVNTMKYVFQWDLSDYDTRHLPKHHHKVKHFSTITLLLPTDVCNAAIFYMILTFDIWKVGVIVIFNNERDIFPI